MKKCSIHILTILLACLIQTSFLFAQNPYRGDTTDCSDVIALSWVKIAGDIDDDAANGVTVDNDGNIIVTGYFRGTMTFQSESVPSLGGSDFFLAKLDGDGILIWLITGGGPQDDFGTGVAVDENNNISVIGGYGGTANFGGENTSSWGGGKDIFLVQYSTDGDFIWDAYPGGYNDDSPGNIAVDNNNNVVISGTYSYALGIGSGNIISNGANDFFAAKYTSTGDFLWATGDGSTADDSSVSIACDDSGNVFVTGEFSGEMEFGSTSLNASGTTDIYLAKYNSDGDFQWAKKAGTAGDNDKACDVTTDIFGNSYLYYKNDQTTDMARIDKYNSGGTLQFGIGFGDLGTINPKSITVDNSQVMYVSGMFSGTTDFGDGTPATYNAGSDYFIAKYNSDGSFNYKDVAGSELVDCGNSICLDQDNNIIVGGFCNTGIFFGSTPYSGYSKYDVMVVKYDRFFSFGDIEISSQGCDPNDMCVNISILGGVPPFTYYWDNVVTPDLDFCGISLGNHQVIVTDENDCFIETTINFVPPTGPEITLPSNITACPYDTVALFAETGEGDFTFAWSNDSITQTIYVYEAGTYSVTVTDISGCTNSESVLLTKYPVIDIIEETERYICFGTATTFSLSGYLQYLWPDGSNDPDYTTSEGGIISIRTYNGICYYYDTVEVIQYPKPDLELGDDVVVCEGDSIEIFAPAGFVSYTWQDNSTGQSFWASEAGTVSVTIQDGYGCEFTDELGVTNEPSPVIDLGEDAVYCTDELVLVDPNDTGSGNTYLWSTGSTNPTISVHFSGTYSVEVTNVAGCSSSDEIVLRIFPAAHVNLGSDIGFCEGGSEELDASGDFISWDWHDGTHNSTLTASETGTYSVTVTDENLCTATDQVFVTESMIEDPFLGYDTTLCDGDSYRLSPEDSYFKYIWNTGSSASYLNITQPGFYSLTVTDNIGCSASSSINIEFRPGPVLISVNSGGGNITINATGGTPPLIYSHDGDTWQTSNVISNLPSDTYTIWIMDKNYCIITTETFLDQSLDIPSFFTPNGDGYNDYWVITGLYHFPGAEIQIFDRFGKMLFESKGSDFAWNGRYFGNPLPSDTYWYTIRLFDGNDPLTGHVTIKR